MLRFIEAEKITQAVTELCVKANTCIGADIKQALNKARILETSPLALTTLDTLLENADAAEREKLPLCQDTGMAVVFVSIGSDVHINGDVDAAINEGVRRGYKEGYCRNSVVRDPINRINTGDNTPAVIYYDFIPGNKLRITVAPKGFGSENMSGVRMLNPSDGLSGVESFIVETVRSAGANPCPPIIVGVGIGGTMEKAALMSKQALLREVGGVHTDSSGAKEVGGVHTDSSGAKEVGSIHTDSSGTKEVGSVHTDSFWAKEVGGVHTDSSGTKEVGSVHTDSFWGEMEIKLLKRINELDIGPAGFGGKTTALGVHILTYPTHIAGLPVAVNIGCHATRHRTVTM